MIPHSIPSLHIEPLESRIAPAAMAAIDLADLDAANGFKLLGEAALDSSGHIVSSAGDVNGDGFDDVIIGTSMYNNTNDPAPISGAAYVVFGAEGGFPDAVELSSLDGTNGFRLHSTNFSIHGGSDGFGTAVGGAGDINGDGFDDIVVGAPLTYGNPPLGASYVVFGRASGFPADMDIGGLDGRNGFVFIGKAMYSGYPARGGIDVNGDGLSDLFIASEFGYSHVIFGRASGFPAGMALGDLDSSDGFTILGDGSYSVSGAGDVNGDGFGDLIVGAGPDLDPSSGAAYVIFGKAGSFTTPLDPLTLDGNNGFKIQRGTEEHDSEFRVSGPGDINGDGFADLLLGAYRGYTDSSAGASYVIFGKATGFTTPPNLSALDGHNGFKIPGEAANDLSGRSVSGAGDVNGDGFADLLIGSPGADPNGSASGASYVIFGKATGFTTPLNLAALDGSDGFEIQGEAAGDAAGRSVSAAGDFNGDGFDDLLIGAPFAHANGSHSGAAYVVYGFNSGTDITNNAGVLNIAGNGKTATFTDVDGDTITVKITIGTLDTNNFTLLQPLGAVLNGAQLAKLDLSDPEFQLSGVTITAKRGQLGGDGRVNVGFIDANGVDLGAVNVAGDLGQIDAGDGNALKPAVASLTVQSLGRLGTTTQDLGASLESDFDGKLGKLTVKGGIAGASLDVDGDLGPVSIKSGITSIEATDEGLTLNLNRVRPAFIDVTGNIASLTVGAGIFGLFGVNGRGIVAGGSIGAVKISGDIFGSSIAADSIKSLTVNGSMSTGAFVTADGALGAVKISGGLFLGGISGGTIGAVKIGRDLFGSVIAAQGNFNPASNSQALAIKSLTVGGDVAFSQVLAGYQSDLFNPPIAVNGNVQIGKVSVSGDWIASDLVAGIDFGADEMFGVGPSGVDDDDVIAGGLVNPIVSQIAGIVIKGQVLGTAGSADHFAFTAEKINSLKVGGTAFPLTTGGTEDLLVGSTNDVRVREI